jgi:hypothetical protein
MEVQYAPSRSRRRAQDAVQSFGYGALVLAVVLSAVDHPWRLDLSTLAALLVATGTGALAFYTWRLARQTRNLARETEEDVRAEWRPVLIAGGSLDAVAGAGSDRCSVSLRLANVGRGPALNTEVTISSQATSEEETSDKLRVGTIRPDREGTATTPMSTMLYRDVVEGPRSWLTYMVRVNYWDLSGRLNETVLAFDDPEKGRRAPAPPSQGVGLSLEVTFTDVRRPRPGPAPAVA